MKSALQEFRMRPLSIFVTLTLAMGAAARAQMPSTADNDASREAISIERCIVSISLGGESRECTSAAARRCNGKLVCEMPIGAQSLIGNDYIGPEWPSVAISYRCGGSRKSWGPHDVNDHGMAELYCP
jgi:hypothetical protein